MWLLCGVLPIVAVLALLLFMPEHGARLTLVGLLLLGSALAGFSVAVPVRRAENRGLSGDEKLSTYGALGGLLLTALGTLGFSALDFSGWSLASLGAFLLGSFLGTAGGLRLSPEPGKRADSQREDSVQA